MYRVTVETAEGRHAAEMRAGEGEETEADQIAAQIEESLDADVEVTVLYGVTSAENPNRGTVAFQSERDRRLDEAASASDISPFEVASERPETAKLHFDSPGLPVVIEDGDQAEDRVLTASEIEFVVPARGTDTEEKPKAKKSRKSKK